MLLVGIAFLIFAALVQWAAWSVPASAAVVGAGLVVLSFILGSDRWQISR